MGTSDYSDEFKRDAVHPEWCAFPFARIGLGFVGFEGGQVIAVMVPLGPCQGVAGSGPLSHFGLAGFVVALRAEKGSPKLGDGGDLVDPDGSLEHEAVLTGGGRIVISIDNPPGNSLRHAFETLR